MKKLIAFMAGTACGALATLIVLSRLADGMGLPKKDDSEDDDGEDFDFNSAYPEIKDPEDEEVDAILASIEPKSRLEDRKTIVGGQVINVQRCSECPGPTIGDGGKPICPPVMNEKGLSLYCTNKAFMDESYTAAMAAGQVEIEDPECAGCKGPVWIDGTPRCGHYPDSPECTSLRRFRDYDSCTGE